MGATGIRQRRRVRVWFGDHPIVNQIADPALANRFEAAMRRRFPSLKVTNDPIPTQPPASTGRWQSGPC